MRLYIQRPQLDLFLVSHPKPKSLLVLHSVKLQPHSSVCCSLTVWSCSSVWCILTMQPHSRVCCILCVTMQQCVLYPDCAELMVEHAYPSS